MVETYVCGQSIKIKLKFEKLAIFVFHEAIPIYFRAIGEKYLVTVASEETELSGSSHELWLHLNFLNLLPLIILIRKNEEEKVRRDVVISNLFVSDHDCEDFLVFTLFHI